MANSTLARVATLDKFVEVVDDIAGVDLRQLAPMTTLQVTTRNSQYRIVISRGTEVFVQGGLFFPEMTPAYLDGASVGGSCLKVGWIGIGLVMEIREGDRRIITSPVRAIATEHPSAQVH